ncbi:MAG: MlaD family protein, partial [Halioglobus sp.]|nr:MlaD family protein [Halioglobus sp.]
MKGEEAIVRRAHALSSVWFIPILALILGLYMVVHNWVSQGPVIEIAFSTANGLEPGQTRIKYRNVDMGVVDNVRLNEEFDGIIATAKLDKQATPLLREDTRFWVVTAQVGLDRITGLDTLLSGAYIQLSPGSGEEGRRSFDALDQPPLTPTHADGLRLQLTSSHATSVSNGDAVLFRGFRVGRVENVRFDPVSRIVRYVIFIDAPYHELVNSSVRFWDVSGIAITATTEGVEVNTGSLDTVLLGGIAFGTPPGIPEGEPVEHNAQFRLYETYDEIVQNPYTFGTYYVASFSQTIKGLAPGAPVEYRGIPIGRVERLLLRESMSEALAEGFEGRGR